MQASWMENTNNAFTEVTWTHSCYSVEPGEGIGRGVLLCEELV